MVKLISKKVCEDSLLWILNYRHCKKHGNNFAKIIDTDGHSGGSWAWTQNQSTFIDKHGLHHWINTDNSLGYRHYLDKIIK